MSNAALIDIDGVDVEIDGTTILHDVRWRLGPGEHWGVVGLNGSGKSTLLALIAGQRWPAPGKGQRNYDFGDGPERDAVVARREITLVGHELQDRYTRLGWNFKAIDVVLSGRFRTDVLRLAPAPEDVARARTLLTDAGLGALAERPFLELSRGEQRRVLIARALAFAPRVLLLDEPASGLDAAARRSLDALLERIARNVQIVATAHTVEDLPGVVTHVALVEAGRIVASGPAKEIRSRAESARIARAPAATANRGGTAPAAAIDAEASTADADAETLIDVRGADVWLGGRHVLKSIDWQLRDGEHWLVLGANGSGKSTFLRMLHAQLRPARGGTIRFPALGDPRSVWELRKRVAWVSPELQAGYRYRSTVTECVASGFDSSLGLVRRLEPHERERVGVLLERFDLTRFADRLQTELSYGQFRRVLLARALVHRPRVLLLDEPWEGLDRHTAELIAARLDECVAEGTTLVCVSHLSVYEQRFTRELELEHGVIAARRHRVKPRADAGA